VEPEKYLKQDINLISLFGLKICSNYSDGIATIYISTANAKRPDEHPLTIMEVVDYAKQAVRSDFPDENKYLLVVTEKSVKEIYADLRKNEPSEK